MISKFYQTILKTVLLPGTFANSLDHGLNKIMHFSCLELIYSEWVPESDGSSDTESYKKICSYILKEPQADL